MMGVASANGEQVTNHEVILYAGQHIPIGKVTVRNDSNYIYIRYQLDKEGWCITETHVHIALSLNGFPRVGKEGNPVPGQFSHKQSHDCVTNYEYRIPLGTLTPGTEVLIAAHAAVEQWGEDGFIKGETAWGEGTRFTKKGNWGTYYRYTIRDNGSNDECECENETAYVGDKDINVGTLGAWWYYFAFEEGTHDIIAGQHNKIGSVDISLGEDNKVNIIINLDDGWVLNYAQGESVKIYGYDTEPSGSRPIPGHSTYKGNTLELTVNLYDYYVIHLDVVNCICD